MPKPDPLAAQPSADIIEFFERCSRGERIEVKLATRALATRFRHRINTVRAKLRKSGQYTHWGIVEVALTKRVSPDGQPLGYAVVGQLRDAAFETALTNALREGNTPNTFNTPTTPEPLPPPTDADADITSILNANTPSRTDRDDENNP